MTPSNLFAALRFRDADAALEWLARAFGTREHAVHRDGEGRVVHAELLLGEGILMLGPADFENGWLGGSSGNPRASTVSIYAVVPDPDAHHARAAAAGAEIVRALQDTPYGSREYSARDLEGNLWSFGTYDPYDPPA
jgi:uncharacterized glyoxalase superfamily protein PhnB